MKTEEAIERMLSKRSAWLSGMTNEEREAIDHLIDEARKVERYREALRFLLADSQHVNHDCGDDPENCPVLAARLLLAEADVTGHTLENVAQT